MKFRLRRTLHIASLAVFLAPAGLRAQSGGLAPEWDVRAMLTTLTTEAKRLKPVLDKVNPKEWVAQGASETYISQWKYSQNELQYFIAAAEDLSKQPEKLSIGLEALFRMQAMERFMNSLSEGIRRYQNPALADLLQGVMVENWNNREKLRQYIVDLAVAKEEDLEAMDREAQRCRAMLSQQPAPGAQGKQQGGK